LGRISDIESMQVAGEQTKECVFCGEMIQARAVKCRYCAEFLNTAEAKALEAQAQVEHGGEEDEQADEEALFYGRPSLWGLAGSVVRAVVFLGLAAFLVFYPIEEHTIFQPDFDETAGQIESESGFSEAQLVAIGQYRIIAGIALAGLVLLILFIKVFRLKMICYEVSDERIEWSRGILDRRVDNLDMFRVVDLRLRRSLLDCIFGIGTVSLITTDKTDPEFVFRKIRRPRRLYDVIKKASLDADRRDGAVHLE